MQKAVFLDRDGVINKERGDYTFKVKDFIINDGIKESIELLKKNGYLIIIISNQGGIAKGLYKKEDVENLHNIFVSLVGENNISDFYYCPHHHEIENCLCRKPGSLMFEKAIAKYNIDKTKTYMIGDSDRDIIASEKAGIKSIKIKPNQNIFQICKNIINNTI